MSTLITDILQQTPLWVARYVPDTGKSVELPQTRLPEGLDARLVSYYVSGEFPERIERGAPLMGERWKTLMEEQLRDPSFDGTFRKAEAACNSLIVSHGELPSSDRFFVSWYWQLERFDILNASRWLAFIKTLLPQRGVYESLMDFIRQSPRNVHSIFSQVAPEIDNSERLNPETKRAVLLAVPFYGGKAQKTYYSFS